MLTPLSWLKDYVDIDVTPKELEEKLFSCGFEVEESYEVGKDISNVVVVLVAPQMSSLSLFMLFSVILRMMSSCIAMISSFFWEFVLLSAIFSPVILQRPF